VISHLIFFICRFLIKFTPRKYDAFLLEHLLPPHKFKVGDLVIHIDSMLGGEVEFPVYEVEYLFFDMNTHPITIVRSSSGGKDIMSINEDTYMIYNGSV